MSQNHSGMLKDGLRGLLKYQKRIRKGAARIVVFHQGSGMRWEDYLLMKAEYLCTMYSNITSLGMDEASFVPEQHRQWQDCGLEMIRDTSSFREDDGTSN